MNYCHLIQLLQRQLQKGKNKKNNENQLLAHKYLSTEVSYLWKYTHDTRRASLCWTPADTRERRYFHADTKERKIGNKNNGKKFQCDKLRFE